MISEHSPLTINHSPCRFTLHAFFGRFTRRIRFWNPPGERFPKRLGRDRLADIGVHACCQASFAVSLHRISRYGDDRNSVRGKGWKNSFHA